MYKLKSVKFWLSAYVLLVATAFVPFGYITGTIYLSLIGLTGNGYYFANVLSKKYTRSLEKKLQSRKFWCAAFVLLSSSAFVPFGYLPGTTWAAVVTLVLNGYFFSNVLEKREKSKEAKNEKES